MQLACENKHLILKYQRLEKEMLIGYSNTDGGGDADDQHSTAGNIL